MNETNIVDIRDIKNSCSHCSILNHCLSCKLHDKELDEFNATIKRRKIFQRGDILFSNGSSFHSLYIVHSGSVKSKIDVASGEEQVTGFHFPGELLGIDGIENGHHTYNATALETTSICEINYHYFNSLLTKLPSLQQQFLKIISCEITAAHTLHGMLGKMTAEQRLASFLLAISDRLHARGNSAKEFNLSMPRQDIANYLGLAVETVSRVLTRFQDSGLVIIDKRNITLCDRDKLNTIIDPGLKQSHTACSTITG